MAELDSADQIWYRDMDGPDHAFEPTGIQARLQADNNLGHLIFGNNEWQTLGGVTSSSSDPLTEYFRMEGTSLYCIITFTS